MYIRCPYCQTGVEAMVVQHVEHKGTVKGILECPRCKEVCFAEHSGFIDQNTGELVWHIVHPIAPAKEDPTIPVEVMRDYKEATMCCSVGAYRATAAMCRRALQTSVLEKGASKNRLVDQIDELLAKGVIPPPLAEWSHEIRFWGNIGVHPDEDGLEDITADDALEILRFTEEYLEYVYLMPRRIQTSKEKRESMKPEQP